jgi:uncharacterized protein (TIGR00730 family)
MAIENVLVFCASSRSCEPVYHEAAARLGEILAGAGRHLVYGGGAAGSMGALADAALAAGGRVTGILPRFMADLEWGHSGLTRLDLVDGMHQRKQRMVEACDAVVALPGGSGTFEELFEVMTLKRLGLFCGPIVLVDTRGFFQPLVALLESSIRERFMDERHRAMWQLVAAAEDVVAALESAPQWTPDARQFAAV